MDPEVTRKFEFMCKTDLLEVVTADLQALNKSITDEKIMKRYNRVVALLLQTIQSDLSKLHVVNERGFSALLDAFEEGYIFKGNTDPVIYVNILTWALRSPDDGYLIIRPPSAQFYVDKGLSIIRFNMFFKMIAVDNIEEITGGQHWYNQYILDYIDAKVHGREAKYDYLSPYNNVTFVKKLVGTLGSEDFKTASDMLSFIDDLFDAEYPILK